MYKENVQLLLYVVRMHGLLDKRQTLKHKDSTFSTLFNLVVNS
jgi:hypothetical protein